METGRFDPNIAQIQKRAQIVPHGQAATYQRVEPTVIEFKLIGAEMDIPAEGVSSVSQPQVAVSAYVPPTLDKRDFRPSNNEITVRVTNIPLHMTHRELYDLLMDRCGRIFNRCNLVSDKETRVSKGVAYVGCDNMEKASEFAKSAMNVVVDNFKLCVEILPVR